MNIVPPDRPAVQPDVDELLVGLAYAALAQSLHGPALDDPTDHAGPDCPGPDDERWNAAHSPLNRETPYPDECPEADPSADFDPFDLDDSVIDDDLKTEAEWQVWMILGCRPY